jgi:BirA family biotin operon repressor/biotin-[acetyl-CoA-carboxylase] ligase
MPFEPVILNFASLPSTNTEAADQARKGAAEGLCVIAEEQTAGRGRLQRQWVSPRGAGLYLSIVLQPELEQRYWTLITLAAALAVHDALLDACGLETEIKWPNDLVVNDRKICGILAETFDNESVRGVVVGIGINLTSAAFPEELTKVVTSVESASGRTPDREVVLKSLLQAFGRRYLALQGDGGREEIIRAWSKRSPYAEGKRIRVTDNGDIVEGAARGLETDGALRVETDAGEIKVIHAGDVTVIKSQERAQS